MPLPESTTSDNSVLFQKDYDKESQHQIETDISDLIGRVTGYCIQVGSNFLSESDVVGHVIAKTFGIIQKCKQLYIKYHEDTKEVKPEIPHEADWRKNGLCPMCGKDRAQFEEGMKVFCSRSHKVQYQNMIARIPSDDYTFILQLEKSLTGVFLLDATYLISSLKILQDIEIRDIAVKHKLMDRTTEKEPWELETKKKFWLNDLDEAYEEYAQSIIKPWKRLNFYETCYMVLKGGDIIKLISGPNNSGKTWTDIPQAAWVNWLLRNFWAKQEDPMIKPDIMEGLKKIERFTMPKNVMFYPDADMIRSRVSDGSMFNTVCITEGLKAAINLKSWDPGVIDMITEMFTERSSHNYIAFEYQLARRPPKMLVGRFNEWQHKMNQKWMVVSMPSSIYRTEDPLYTTEVEKLKGDRRISSWFTHRSGNTNFIAKMKTPKLKDRYDKQFKKLRKIAKEELEKGMKIKKGFGSVWYLKIEEYWKQVHDGQIAYMNLRDILSKKHQFTDEQVVKFMREYDKFDREQKLLHPIENASVEE